VKKNAGLTRSRRIATAVVAGALALTACASDPAEDEASANGASAATGDPYVIGFNDDLSGPISFAGLTNLAGIETYFDYVNEEKGGVNGHPIELVKLDNRADGAAATANYTQLVEDEGALAVLGNSASSAWAASGRQAAQLKVPQMGFGNADEYFTTYNPYLFKNGMVVTQQDELLAQVVEDYLFEGESDGLSVAILASDTASGPLHIEAVEKAAGERGWDIAETQLVAIGATDCTAQAAQIAQASPDVVLSNVTSVGEDIICFQQLQARGYDGPVVNTNSSSTENTYKTLASPNWVSLRMYSWWEDEAEEGMVTMRERAETFGHAEQLGAYSSDGYVAAMAIEAALLECGDDCTGEKVQAALEALGGLDTQGIAGPAFGWVEGDLGHTIPQARAYVWDDAEEKSVPLTDWLCVPDRDC
jgi:branched-chain amino acid transport system substrate-binding protein